MPSNESKTSIGNLALGHLGSGREIQNIETEQTDEAAACRRYYDPALKEAMRDFTWPFATVFADLGLVETEPNDEWNYSYRYPSDCSMFRRILSGIRNDTRQSKVSYKIGRDAQGLLIYTDQQNAQCEYTIFEDDPARYPHDFVMAFSFLLANYMAPRITQSGDTAKLGERALKLYVVWIEKARANALNEQQDDEEPESQFIRDRN